MFFLAELLQKPSFFVLYTDEVGTNKYIENETNLTLDMRNLEISLNEKERKKSSEYEAEREKQHCEEMKKEEQKRQIERDFQKELRKIMEAEKVSHLIYST